jgi:hypothetical protein
MVTAVAKNNRHATSRIRAGALIGIMEFIVLSFINIFLRNFQEI